VRKALLVAKERDTIEELGVVVVPVVLTRN